MFIPRDRPSSDEWEYFVFSNHTSFYMRPAENLPNLFQPILMVRSMQHGLLTAALPPEFLQPSDLCFPNCNTNVVIHGRAAFAVGDYLERHPTDERRWKLYGRTDDQIVLSTAEHVRLTQLEER